MSGDLKITSKGALGALVEGVDLSQVTPQQMGELAQAFADHEVLFFEHQSLAPEAHLAFAERWGEINVNRFFAHVDGHPAIAQVIRARAARQYWRLLAYGPLLRSNPCTRIDAVSQRGSANRRRYVICLLHQGLCYAV